jgi:hypothetical protein
MQRAANKIKIALVLLLVGLWCYGCGTGDILDENGHRYQTDVEFTDAEEDGVLSIDVYQNGDCNGDGNFTDPEPFTDVLANIEVTAIEDAPGLTMTGYKVSFKPLTSTDITGSAYDPPDMPIVYTGTYDVDIPTNSSVSFWITCMEIDMKLYMGTQLPAAAVNARYEVTIRMDFVDEYGQPRDLTIRRTLYFGSYDNC